MARPYWSGHLRISLVSFGIQLFPATEAKGEIHFHQLDRKTGERIKHQNVSTDQDPLDKEDIVKGYEYTKGKYVVVEQEDIDNLRIASRETLEVTQFIGQDELDPKFYEKPYFVTPEDASQAEAFAVVRKALEASGKVALGKIAFGGREHLVAIAVPANDAELGMMAYTLRYEEELRKPADYFGDIKKISIDDDQLALAKQLIEQKSSAFNADKFKDEYETALRTMIEAKVKNQPLPREAPAAKSTKVVSLMDALRKSVQGSGETKTDDSKQLSLVKPAAKPAARPAAKSAVKSAVKTEAKSSKSPKAAAKRKSA